MQWLGPRGVEMRIDHVDGRTGGSYRSVHTADGQEHGRGCSDEVRSPEVVVQTFIWQGRPDGVALERLVLEDLRDGRTRLTAMSLVDSFRGPRRRPRRLSAPPGLAPGGGTTDTASRPHRRRLAMTLPTPFPGPDPLPPDPITPVEPSPLRPAPTPTDPDPERPLP